MSESKPQETKSQAGRGQKPEAGAIHVGDSVKVQVRVNEGGLDRIKVFAGIVISKSGTGLNESITVRQISHGEGVERTFQLNSPKIQKIERTKRGSGRPKTLASVVRRPAQKRPGHRIRMSHVKIEAISGEVLETTEEAPLPEGQATLRAESELPDAPEAIQEMRRKMGEARRAASETESNSESA